MEGLVEHWRVKHGVPGLVVAITLPGDKAEIAVCGLANIAEATPATTDTVFRCCSLTKVLMAYVTLKLDELAVLSLDDPVRDYVGEDNYYLGLSEYSDDIRIRHLLQHTNGLPDPTQSLENLIVRGIELRSLGIGAAPPQNSTVASLDVFPPGEKCRYSNPGYLLLGEVLENATGNELDSLLNEFVCAPLGLQSMCMDPGIPQPAMAEGYKVIDGRLEPVSRYEGGGLTRGAGALISNTGDLMVFAHRLFHGDLLSDEQWQAMTDWRPIDERGGGGEYGLGLMRRSLGGRETIGHRGESMGFRAEMLYLPASDTLLLILANIGEADLMELADEVLSYHGL
jgi:CubicO group peptidase (beta-lactamase class C family)